LLRFVGPYGQWFADIEASFGDDGGVKGGNLSSSVWKSGDSGDAGGEGEGAEEGREKHFEYDSKAQTDWTVVV
jgi:hypothetical protein